METIVNIENSKDNKKSDLFSGLPVKKFFVQSYGCQMNLSDSEIVSSILTKEGFLNTSKIEEADLVFLNTCSIREKAELTIRKRLAQINTLKKSNPELIIGILGCMAERLKSKLLEEEKLVDLVAGPDAYRSLPELIEKVKEGNEAINTFLSRDETYSDIDPMRLNSNGVSGFISIMRGCDNMCSFCVVPFTRGRERSRDPESIVDEAKKLFNDGYREVTLLGQNVDSYNWKMPEYGKEKSVKLPIGESVNFAQLLDLIAQINPQFRVRFSTSHPKDITDEVLYTMARHSNICRYIHLPAQSGNSRVLELMNRGYSREWYLNKIDRIREILGFDCGISSDMIAGFCSETEKEHEETLSLMEYIKFDFAYTFMYSERPGTLAAKKYKDDIPLAVKQRRLEEIISLQNQHSLEKNNKEVGKVFKVLIEGYSKRSNDFLQGRNSANKVIVFPKEDKQKGDYVNVLVDSCSKATLMGKIIF